MSFSKGVYWEFGSIILSIPYYMLPTSWERLGGEKRIKYLRMTVLISRALFYFGQNEILFPLSNQISGCCSFSTWFFSLAPKLWKVQWFKIGHAKERIWPEESQTMGSHNSFYIWMDIFSTIVSYFKFCSGKAWKWKHCR